VPALVAYYRVTPTGNGKPRPAWFSRRTCLLSFLNAAQRVGAEVVVVADGGVPAELADLVPGRVVTIRGGSAARSFRGLLDVVDRSADLVWLAEDDYLYRPEALEAVCAAAGALPHADYFGVYTPDNAAWHADHRSQPAAGRDGRCWAVAGREGRCWDIAGRTWRRAWDSTSTFGVRGAALREDTGLLRLCSRAGGPWDHTCVLAVQGVRPYPWRHLYADLYLRPSRASAGRVVTRPAVRAAVDVAALRRAGRTWVAPVRDLATHAEPGYVAAGTDWAAVAGDLTLGAVPRLSPGGSG
jgi:hypothetical protein